MQDTAELRHSEQWDENQHVEPPIDAPVDVQARPYRTLNVSQPALATSNHGYYACR